MKTEIQDKIIKRYESLRKRDGHSISRMDVALTLDAVDDAMGLDVDRLMGADDINFMHDVAGMVGHIDPATGQLLRGFRPRYVKDQ